MRASVSIILLLYIVLWIYKLYELPHISFERHGTCLSNFRRGFYGRCSRGYPISLIYQKYNDMIKSAIVDLLEGTISF
jgi:hypothetical protein